MLTSGPDLSPAPIGGATSGLQFYLEDLLGRHVDLAMDGELRSEILPYVERDLI